MREHRWHFCRAVRLRADLCSHLRTYLAFDLAVAATLVVTLTVVLDPAPQLVWNASASAPRGLYWRTSGAEVARGDFVLVRARHATAELAAERGYLPADVPLIKRVAAIAGDHACTSGSSVLINGRVAARVKVTDSKDRPLAAWQGCRRLDQGEAFLLMEDIGSFDSRYFGPVTTAEIVGRLVPLWTF